MLSAASAWSINPLFGLCKPFFLKISIFVSFLQKTTSIFVTRKLIPIFCRKQGANPPFQYHGISVIDSRILIHILIHKSQSTLCITRKGLHNSGITFMINFGSEQSIFITVQHLVQNCCTFFFTYYRKDFHEIRTYSRGRRNEMRLQRGSARQIHSTTASESPRAPQTLRPSSRDRETGQSVFIQYTTRTGGT